MNPNSCRLCGKKPVVDLWGSLRRAYSAYCYDDVETHALNTYGATREEAVRRWNRLNPAHRQSMIRRILNILGLGVRHEF